MIDMGKFPPQFLQMGFLHIFACCQTGDTGIDFAPHLLAPILHTRFAAFQEQIKMMLKTIMLAQTAP